MLKKRKKANVCTVETCGDCYFYKYYSSCGYGCHLTPDTRIIRQGPITKDCPYKLKISKAEQRTREKERKVLHING